MTVPGTTSTPDTEKFVAQAAELAPMLRGSAAATEAARMVSSQVIDEFRSRGLLRLMQPARFGGHEADQSTMLLVTAELAAACGSTGWVYGVLASHCWILGLFPDEAQHDVWDDDPEAIICTSVGAPGPVLEPVDGGYRLVGGAFPFSSGCDHASWAIVGCRAEDGNGGIELRWALLPISEIEIEDTWYAAGLRGTGSKTLHIADSWIPAHRTAREPELTGGTPPGAAANEGPLYRMPLRSGFPIALVATVIGSGRGAVAALAERLAARGAPPFPEGKDLETLAAVRLGEAGAKLDAATRLMQFDDRELMARLVAGGEVLTPDERARHSLHFSLATELSVDAVETVFLGAGGSAILESSDLQRYWRDLHAAASHAAFNWDLFRLRHGRALAASFAPGAE